MKRFFYSILIALLPVVILTALEIQPVRADDIIYIRADGSVDPPTAPISTLDNVTYTFTDNIYGTIVIQRDNIIVDGASCTVQGAGATHSEGISFTGRNHITIMNTIVENARVIGISLYNSSNNNVSGNIIINSGTYGILLSSYSHDNTFSGNNITNCGFHGIWLEPGCSNNSISRNSIENTVAYGIYLYLSSNNTVSKNSVTNTGQYGIYLREVSYSTVSENNIRDNKECGIRILLSSYDNISRNKVTNTSQIGLFLQSSSNNFFYHNDFINNTEQVRIVYPDESPNVWDDGYPSGGNFWSDHTETDLFFGPYQNETGSDGIVDSPYTIEPDNVDHYPLAEPWVAPDLSLVRMNTSKTGCVPVPTVCQSYDVTVNAEIANIAHTVQSLKLRVYANETLVKEFEDTHILNGKTVARGFEWNTTGFSKGNYTLTAVIEPILGEVNTSDNTMQCWILVTNLGDINSDQVVDIFDCASIALAFGSRPGDSNWNPNADINNDGIVDIFDLVVVALRFGETG